jgi:predicted metal-dependent peptidase
MKTTQSNIKIIKKNTGGGQGGQGGQGGGQPPNVIPWGKPPQGKNPLPPRKQPPTDGKQSPTGGKGKGGETLKDKLNKQFGDGDKHFKPTDKHDPVPAPKGRSEFERKMPDGSKSRDQKEKEKQSRVDEAVRKGKQERVNRGDTGKGLPERFTGELTEVPTDWRPLIKKFIKGKNKEVYNPTRPRKRQLARGYFSPAKQKVPDTLESVIAIDTSGSIDRETLNIFLSYILDIYEKYPNSKIRILLWHTEVYKDILLDGKDLDFDGIKQELMNIQSASGGTTISCINDHLEEEGVDELSGLMVFTDGEVEMGFVLPDAKRKLFLITMNGSLDPLINAGGEIYRIRVEKNEE